MSDDKLDLGSAFGAWVTRPQNWITGAIALIVGVGAAVQAVHQLGDREVRWAIVGTIIVLCAGALLIGRPNRANSTTDTSGADVPPQSKQTLLYGVGLVVSSSFMASDVAIT